jgi:hypothetical protein
MTHHLRPIGRLPAALLEGGLPLRRPTARTVLELALLALRLDFHQLRTQLKGILALVHRERHLPL